MKIAGAESRQRHAGEEYEPGAAKACRPDEFRSDDDDDQAGESYDQERQVRSHVPEIRDPEHRSLVGEIMVSGVLGDRLDRGEE